MLVLGVFLFLGHSLSFILDGPKYVQSIWDTGNKDKLILKCFLIIFNMFFCTLLTSF